MRNRKIKIVFFTLLLFTVFACSNEPTSIGDALIPNSDRIALEKMDSYNNSFNQTFSTFQKDSLFFGTANRVLLGSYKNISIDMLLGFGILFPDSLKESINNNEVILKSSWIEMKPNYWIGDKSHLKFSVKEINQNWSSSSFNQDTLNAVKASLGDDILIQDSYSFSDSLIKFSIDEQVVNKWIKQVADNTFALNNGLYFTPISKTGIVGFQAIARFITSSFITLNMVFEKPGVYTDTLKAVQSKDMHIVNSTEPEKNENSLILQSSSSVRGKLWFDVSSLPANAILNKATLSLYIDEQHTFQGKPKTDSVVVSFYEDKVQNLIKKEYGISVLFNKTNNAYSGDIRQFVQRWINGENNEGMEIKLSDEDRSANTIAFFKSDYQVDSLRPRLTIFYTTVKEK